MPLRALGSNGSGTLSDIAKAITYAADNGADVINLSLGSRFSSVILERAVDYAWQQGVFVTCAAGNSSSFNREYRASYDNCVAVGSTRTDDSRSSFSNYGKSQDQWVDVTAPGSGIYSTWPTNSYTALSGTSMAAPHVASLAGLLASQGLTNDQIRLTRFANESVPHRCHLRDRICLALWPYQCIPSCFGSQCRTDFNANKYTNQSSPGSWLGCEVRNVRHKIMTSC